MEAQTKSVNEILGAHRDPQEAFEVAIQCGCLTTERYNRNYAADYMYMGDWDGAAHFKHSVTREYISHPLKQEFKVTATVPVRRVCDLLISAFEGGSSYWAQGAYYAKPDTLKKGDIWYDMPELFTTSGTIFTLHFDDPNKPEGNGKGRQEVGWMMLAAGLEKMQKESPRHFADFIAENDDASTADVFLQYVVFGEVVYG